MTGDKTDAELVEATRRGDREAFGLLIGRHLKAATATALSIARELSEAEDVAQDAFLSALERIEDCRDPSKFAAWLMQIVRNRARNVRRAEGIRNALPLEESIAASLESPSRDLDRSELRSRLTEALNTLPEVQREVVLMHDLYGYKHREIAERLDQPEGTVRSHLSLARRTLRTLLPGLRDSEELEEGDDEQE